MRNSTMTIRFLDLTLILLMAFLFQADLMVEREVGLPHGSASESGDRTMVFQLNLHRTSWDITQNGRRVCAGGDFLDLQRCLDDRGDGAQVSIIPTRGVRVQRLVHVLDVCARLERSCAASAPRQ